MLFVGTRGLDDEDELNTLLNHLKGDRGLEVVSATMHSESDSSYHKIIRKACFMFVGLSGKGVNTEQAG